MKHLNNLKTAIVYDWIDKWGGVERVLLVFAEMFPNADFYTSYYDKKGAPWAKDLKIKSSFIQNLPNFIKKSRILSLPLYPYAFESLNLNEYDLVISTTSSFAKSVITKPETLHISYLLTPTRYVWTDQRSYLDSAFKRLGDKFLEHLRVWDFYAAQRPDHILSISKTVADRSKKYYRRESEVIYPPFDIEYWSGFKSSKFIPPKASQGSKYYLVVSRLEPYKRIDLAVKAFNGLSDKKLIIVGKGRQEKKLKKMAGPNITFLKDLSDRELARLYQGAEALIMPQIEEFGYVALEAQFFGCPVIAYREGGATETVIEGKTGVFFNKQTESSLNDIIKRFNLKKGFAAKHIEKFDKRKFIRQFMLYISRFTTR